MDDAEYSVQQLSQLSGVSARTLRWYHQIGLLEPRRVGENGYRYYGPQQADRLQDILYYRALGTPLAQIKAYLDDPAFNRIAALRSHLAALQAQQARLEELIRSVRQTIQAQERNIIMKDEQKFEAFKRKIVAQNEETYGQEARQKYGDDQVDQSNEVLLNLTQEQYRQWTELGQRIQTGLEQAVQAGAAPESPQGRDIVQLHRRWLAVAGNDYDAAKHRGLAMLYTADPRFIAYYDKNTPGCAQFLQDAILCWTPANAANAGEQSESADGPISCCNQHN